MKSLAFVLLVLVGSLMLTNLPMQSYADPNLDTLLRIATQARDNVNIQLSQLPTVPDEINQLYKQGSDQTDALAQSVSQNDQASSKEHFLTAMKIFKEVNDKISSLTSATPSEQSTQIDTLQLNSEINRMQILGDRLETIATTNNVVINFTKFDQIMQSARQNLNASNADQVNKDLDTANQFLLNVHQLLADAAKMKTSERAKDFTEKQIQRLSQIQEFNPPQNVTQSSNPPQNVTQSTPSTTPLPITTNANSIGNISDMIVKLKQLVSEGKIDEALKLIKLIETLQNQQTNSQIPTNETSNQTQSQNSVNNVNATEITNPANNSTMIEHDNQTQSETADHENKNNQTQSQNNVNFTKNNSTVNNIPHFDNEKNTHENKNNQTQSQNNVNFTKNAHTVNNQSHDVHKKIPHKYGANSENKNLKGIRTNNSED